MRGALGTAAATAAGVAGGAFLFQGIEHLMHPAAAGAAGFMNPTTGAATPAAENTTVNNFYDSDADSKADTPASSTSDTDFLSSDDMSLDDDSSFV
jgi:hypothetical protein